MRTKILFSIFAISAMAQSALAFNIDGSGSSGAPFSPVAMYLFNENSGTVVHDQVTTGGTLNLTIADPTQVVWPGTPLGGGLEFIGNSIAQSTGPATKIINACAASNALTIEAWISPDISEYPYDTIGPARIVALSTGTTSTEGFYFGEDYNAGFEYGLFAGSTNSVSTVKGAAVLNKDVCGGSATAVGCAATTAPNTDPLSVNGTRHVWLTKDASGNGAIYMTDSNGVPAQVFPAVGASANAFSSASANFANWLKSGTGYQLGIGNDNAYSAAVTSSNPLLTTEGVMDAGGLSNQTIQTKPWRGTIYFLAVYCNAMTGDQVLGNLAPTNWIAEETGTVVVNPTAAITPEEQLAQLIYRRIGGITLPIDSPTIASMATALASGGGMNTEASRMAAADIAANLPGFYNRTMKDFAKPMSNRAGSLGVPLNDFTAMFVGAARDNMDARQILQGNFWYEGDTTKAGVRSDMIQDILTSDNHFTDLEVGSNNMPYDLSYVLKQVPSQYYLQPTSEDPAFTGANIVPAAQWDYGGVLTSRNFLAEHAIAGTNRRLVEFTFQEFLCRQMTQWADASAGDQYVGVDVDRFPTGNHTEYQTTCRSCHAQMDGMRPAFSRITFETNFVKHGGIVGADTTDEDPNDANNETQISVMNQGLCTPLSTTPPCGKNVTLNPTISGKYTKNSYVFPTGFIVQDTSWTNLATAGTNGTFFGWQNGNGTSPISGQGVNQFGAMIANSQAYPLCMVQTAFNSVCKRPVQTFDAAVISRVVADFTSTTIDNYNFRKMFERMTVQPECLGQ
jgi:hypothetical protein